ncbi:DUF6783 domain-containing protein [Fusicatenibacter sp.]
MRTKSPTNWDSQLMKSFFQTRSTGNFGEFFDRAKKVLCTGLHCGREEGKGSLCKFVQEKSQKII